MGGSIPYSLHLVVKEKICQVTFILLSYYMYPQVLKNS